MDAMQYEDPDAQPKRLIVLAGAGMVVATGFATIAAMALPNVQRNTATPDIMVHPNVVSRSTTSSVPAAAGRFTSVSSSSDRTHGKVWFSSAARSRTDDDRRETGHNGHTSPIPAPGDPQPPGGDQPGQEPPEDPTPPGSNPGLPDDPDLPGDPGLPGSTSENPEPTSEPTSTDGPKPTSEPTSTDGPKPTSDNPGEGSTQPQKSPTSESPSSK